MVKTKTHLCLIEVLHPHAVNRGTQTPGAIGLAGMQRFRAKTGSHSTPALNYTAALSSIIENTITRARVYLASNAVS